jgi:sugar transferase (PEP-CTERM/EpsH1 system associated)
MKILWVKAGGLVPPDTGGKIRSYNILRQLAKRYAVTFFSFYAAHENDVHAELSQIFQQVIQVPLDLPPAKGSRELLDYVTRLFLRDPYNLTKYCRPLVREKLCALLQEQKFDVILCDFLVTAGVIPWDCPCPKVLFSHNVEATIWERHYRVARNPLWKAVAWREWKRMAAAERKYLQKADHVIAVSENDRAVFASFVDPQRLTVIQTGTDTEFFRPRGEREIPSSLVFTGSMDWLPNEDGILYFANEILPMIRRRVPDVTLCVVGRKPSRRLQNLAARTPYIQLTGWVEDVRPYLAQSAVCVVPLRIGGGTRLKIFEAMSMAKAVVSTSIGAEGLPVNKDQHILLADDPASFAESTAGLLLDASRREQIGLAARNLVQENYSWAAVSVGFARALESVVDRVGSSKP